MAVASRRKNAGPAESSRPSGGAVERRAQIVEKASELFDQVGYYTTSMDDIAKAVGLAKPTLYHYFDSKDSILLAVHDEFISLLLTRQRARTSNETADPTELLYEVMFDILDLMRTHRGHVRVFFEHHRELPESARAGATAARDAYFASVADLLERSSAHGMTTGDARLSAMALFGMCNWAYQWYDPKGRMTTQDVARYFHSILLHGVATAAGERQESVVPPKKTSSARGVSRRSAGVR